MQTVTAENVFSRSWTLLTQNWVIIVPGLIVAIVTGILTSLLAPSTTYVSGSDYTSVRSVSVVNSMIIAVIGVIAAIISITYTTGMAGAAWQRGSTALGDGAAAFREDSGHVLSAMLFLFLVGVVGSVLAPFTIGLSILVLFFLFPYTMAAAVLGNLGGIDALRESYRIATQHVATTVIIIVVAAVIAIIGGIIAGILHFVFLIGPIVSAILDQAVLAYLTLVIVGVYLAYRSAAITAAAPVAAAAAPAASATPSATPDVPPAPQQPPTTPPSDEGTGAGPTS